MTTLQQLMIKNHLLTSFHQLMTKNNMFQPTNQQLITITDLLKFMASFQLMTQPISIYYSPISIS